MVISLIAIGGYSFNSYGWLFHYWLLVAILLMVMDGYFINGYWWLFF